MEPNRGGRPKSPNPRRTAIPIRFTDDEATAVKAAADARNEPVGEYIRESAVNRAKRAH